MKQVNMLRYVTLRYVTLRYVNHSFKLSRIFYCKNILKTFVNYIHAFSYALKNQFASLNNNAADAHCVNISEKSTQGVKTPCYSDFASNFEIISRNENYAFNHNKNFCRNGNNQSLRGFSRSNLFSVDCHAYARNDKFVICDDKSKGDYFLAMIMAEILFLVFGIILISAFYLIKKLKKIYFEGEKHNEKDFSNNNGFAYYGKRKCIRYVWS